MSRHTIILWAGGLVLAGLFAVALLQARSASPAAVPSRATVTTIIPYRGERFEVSAANHVLSPEQTAKIENLLRSAQPPPHIKSYADLMEFAGALEFPGCGSSTSGIGETCPLGEFAFVSAQIPLSTRHRTLVFRAMSENSDYVLIDDFIYNGFYPPAFHFTAEDGKLTYRDDKNNQVVRAITLGSATTRG